MPENQSDVQTPNRSRRWLHLLSQTATRLIEHDGIGKAKGAAYSFILLFFPLLLFLVLVLVMSDVVTVLANQLLDLVRQGDVLILPPSTQILITNYIKAMEEREPTNLLVIVSIVMIWMASSLMATFMEGLDRAYHVPPRSMLKQRLVAIGLVLLAGVPLGLLAISTIFGAFLEGFIETQLSLTLPVFWKLAQWGFVLAATMAMIALIYYIGPNRRQTWRTVFPGAALATLLWISATLGFSAYVGRFGRYNLIYGGLGAVIILLIWMYLSSLVVFIGGEFNAVLETARTSAHLCQLHRDEVSTPEAEATSSTSDQAPATSSQ